jgi:hypothetical protein
MRIRLIVLIVFVLGFFSLVHATPVSPCIQGVSDMPPMYYKGGILTPTEPLSKSASIELFFLAHPNHAPAQTCA